MSICNRLEAKSKTFKKFDGGGLYIEVKPNGTKTWRLKYRFRGKEKRLSFGQFPTITINQAREYRREAKILLGQGIDPAQFKKEQELKTIRRSKNTFETIAREWHDVRKSQWSIKHANHVMDRLSKDVFPVIGDISIVKVDTPTLLEMLRLIENRGSYYLAGRIKQICGQVFRYGVQTGRCENNPAMNLTGALKTKRTNHFASINSSELPELLKAISNNDARLFSRTRRALMFSLLTFCRPKEIRRAQWDHINIDEKIWLIPASEMKAGRDHFVPLSKQSVEILRFQNSETGHLNSTWVFPSQTRLTEPMSDGTVYRALQNLGFKGRMTAHGFRALARTAIREKLGYYPDVIEAQLAHKPLGALGAAYDRAQFLDERKIMMQDWADYVFSNTSI